MSRGTEESLVARTAELLAVSISRRTVLDKVLRVASGAVFMAVLGRTGAYAAACTNSCGQCFPPRGVFCQGCPTGYPGGCPQGCTVCTTGQGIGCVYDNGNWSDTCSSGAKIKCWDCKCGPSNITCGCCSGALQPPHPPPHDPPPHCEESYVSQTKTWLITPDGATTDAGEQLGFELHRYESRPETHIYLDEWALLSAAGDQPALRLASTGTFSSRIARSRSVSRRFDRNGNADDGGFDGLDRERSTVLVVEAADQSHDARHMHAPTVEPFQAQLPVRLLSGFQFWFRAEVSAEREVDRLTLLDMPTLAPLSALEAAIRANLRLRYHDEQREHRTVVYGAGTVDSEGWVNVGNGLVIVPKCCCYGWACV